MDNKYFNRVNSNLKNYSFSGKSLAFLVILTTAISFNYFYSWAMMLLTTFALAYLTKGSRRS